MTIESNVMTQAHAGMTAGDLEKMAHVSRNATYTVLPKTYVRKLTTPMKLANTYDTFLSC